MPNKSLTTEEKSVYQTFARLNLPRHTSYPPINLWKETNEHDAFCAELNDLYQDELPVSWYVHVPFCEKLCRYCACNKLVVSRCHSDAQDLLDRYLDGITKELQYLKREKKWRVRQLHFGGGTPTWLSPADLVRLWDSLMTVISPEPGCEISVELDPRVTTTSHLKLLRELGVNRVSLGVQDFDPGVQTAIDRLQPFDTVRSFVNECRDLGFEGINFDLIYGLPRQTQTSMGETLKQVLSLEPDRVAFYRLALLPDTYKWQRTFKDSDIPSDNDTLEMMLLATRIFGAQGYEYIGLDHFAKHTDALSASYRSGTLRRSFQGMTTGDTLPVIGVGPSAISSLRQTYRQNEPSLYKWLQGVSSGLPTVRHHVMTKEDQACMWLVNQLYCYRTVDLTAFDRLGFGAFKALFSDRIDSLQELKALGLIHFDDSSLTLKPMLGWLLLRVVTAALDLRLPANAWRDGLSPKTASRVG